MSKFLVTTSYQDRYDYINNLTANKKIAIYNKVNIGELNDLFDYVYRLDDLYKDEIFLKMLSNIDRNTIVFFIDLGFDYCSFKANYLKSYTKLNPIYQQARDIYIIDGFAFYYTEKSIYRPFLYINPDILNSTVQEFYNMDKYVEFDDNRVEKYYNKIKPYIEIKTKEIEIETITYSPNISEIEDYNRLKEEVIMNRQLPKVKVINTLLNFIDNSESKKMAIMPSIKGILNVTHNNSKSRIDIYKNLLTGQFNKVRFYSSGIYGCDELELNLTKDALNRHNKLIELING